jgi:stage V sporulation protein B
MPNCGERVLDDLPWLTVRCAHQRPVSTRRSSNTRDLSSEAFPRADVPSEPRVESALKRSGHLLVLRCAQYGLAFLGGVIVTRQLGPSGRAQYALPLTLAGVAWVIVHLSIEGSVQRLLARREATLREVTGLLSATTIVMSALAVPLTIGLGLALRHDLLADAPAACIVIAAATIPFSLAGQMAAALLFQLGKLRAYGFIVAASGGLQLTLAATIALLSHISPRTALLIALAVIAATAFALCTALAAELGAGALVPRTSWPLARSALRIGLRLHASSIALFLNLQIDLLLVSAFTNAHDTGIYSLAATLAAMVFVATSTVALAALQTQTDASADVASEYTAELTRQTLALSTILAIVASVGSYPFILVAYGSDWLPSVVPFVVLTAAAVGLGVEAPVRNLLIRVGRPSAISKAAIAALAVNVALNCALIPLVGIVGAALASVASYWCAALLMARLVQRETGIKVREIVAWPKKNEAFTRLVAFARGR